MPDHAPIDLTVSIVSHGHAALIGLLLTDLAKAKCPISRVVLTLNLSDEPVEALRQQAAGLPWPVEWVVNPRPLGFGANHNQAFRREPGQAAFAVVNPDIRLLAQGSRLHEPFSALLAALAVPGTGFAAPQAVNECGAVEDSWRETLTPWQLLVRYGLRRRHAAKTSSATWAAGLFLVFNPQAYRAVGGFDEGYFMYCEDMDLCLRLQDSGLTMALVAESKVVHTAHRASRRPGQHLLWHLRSLARFWWRRAGARVWWRRADAALPP